MHWDLDSEKSGFTPWHNKSGCFENMVSCFFQWTRLRTKFWQIFKTCRLKKIDRFSVNCFCSYCNTVFESMGCFHLFCPCQEVRPALTEESFQHGKKRARSVKRNLPIKKNFTVFEMWGCECSRLYNTTTNVKREAQENFPYGRSLPDCELLEEMKNGKLFGYVSATLLYVKIKEQLLLISLQPSGTLFLAKLKLGS